MSDHTHSSGTPDGGRAPKRWYRPRNILLASAVVLTSGIAGAYVSQSVAEGFGGFGPPGFGPGFHGHMMGGGMMGRLDPAVIEDRADRAVRHLAVEIDATNEQQDKLRVIAKAAVKDLVPMRTKADAAREKAHTLLLQPTVSRADIEAFRVEQTQAIDAFTKRVAQAIGDANEVLTLEQRKKLDELIQRRRAMWQGWRRG
jgi:protein CpxP